MKSNLTLRFVGLLVLLIAAIEPAAYGYDGDNKPSAKPLQAEQKKYGSHLLSIRDSWSYRDAESNEITGGYSDTYTKLLIIREKPTIGKEIDPDHDPFDYRSPVWPRLFRDAHHEATLTAKIVVGRFETTVPLATISHDDGSAGEHWNRSVHYDQLNFPLFLVPADGSAASPSITVTMAMSEEMKSRGASRGLEAALSYARATNPAAKVITTLSEQETKDRARALDDVISSLFTNNIKEEHITDRDLRLLRPDIGVNDTKNSPTGLTVELMVPKDEGKWAEKEEDQVSLGIWTLTFDYPHVSIFSDWRICGNVHIAKCASSRLAAETNTARHIEANSVLNYKLTSTPGTPLSIKAYLSQQDWFVSAMNELASSDPAGVKEKNAANFCKRIENEIAALGLNAFDSHIVAWAVVNNWPLPTDAPAGLGTKDGCNTFSTTKATAAKLDKDQT
jgi:hypothetical protein